MITLYHSMSARSFRPLWTLEELELTYELKMLPFPPRVHRKEYLSTNPLGTVPYFRDDAVEMTESVAICQYLAARYGSTGIEFGPENREFGEYLNWLYFGEATLTFPQTIVLRYSRFEATKRRIPQVVEDYARWFLARLRKVEAAVSSREYLCGDRFTAADISVGYALMLAEQLALSESFQSGVAAYWHRLQERSAFKRALDRQHREAIAQAVPVTPSACVAMP
jgi:glutathione S-transferase